jgi:DNA-binding transcriptional LysR family regulator
MERESPRVPQDLNLLVPLEALLVERHVTRAAARAGTTQPAMSRALQRLRLLLRDELLIRVGGRYELTALGRDLLEQVRALMPAVHAVFDPASFDPADAGVDFRIAGTDYAVAVLGPGITHRIRSAAPGCRLLFESWNQGLGDQLASGAVDAMLVAIAPPAGFRSEPLLEETMVCVVDEQHPLARTKRLTLEDYLRLQHLSITTEGADQATIDGRLAAMGTRRDIVVSAPTHQSGLGLVRGSDLIATLPARLLGDGRGRPGLHVIEAPVPLQDVTLSLVWHPRSDLHEAQRWLRQQVRGAAHGLSEPQARK